MNELKFTGKYSTLEKLREAFPNGGSLGDFATIKGISYYYNPILSDWTTDYPESLFIEKNAYDEIFLGDYPDLGLVWKDYPNGGGQGNYITISGIKYFWNERDRKWEIGIGENIPPGLPEGDPNKFYNEQGKFVYVNTSKYVIYGNYIDDIHFQSNGKDAELKTDTLYIDKDTLKSYIYVNNKLIKTGLTEEEILRLFKKTSVTNTALIKIHSSDGFGLKSDGTTAGLTSYHVYRYNLSSYIDNGVWSAPLKKVAVTGVSSPSTAEEFCLACAYDKNDVFLKAFYGRTGQNYTKQVLEMPANAQYVRVCGTDALMPACYEVEDRWIFYTTEEVDALLAGLSPLRTLLISKSSLNGLVTPSLFSYPKKIKFTAVKCEANCDNFSLKIGATTYDKTSILNVEIDAETAMELIDVNIVAGKNNGNVRLNFKEI